MSIRRPAKRPERELNCGRSVASDETPRKTVLIGGGGLAGLAAARRLVDAGYAVQVLEKRDVLGGKWSAWRDEDGDWLETGLHVFFGAYEEIFTLMRELDLYDNILWKEHVLTYTLENGERFDFRTARLPSPLHLLPTLIANRYFTWPQKLSLARNLCRMLFGSQTYYDRIDVLSYADWHRQHGISDRLLQKMFVPLSGALKFVRPEAISAKIVLDVSGTFLRVNGASRMGFLKGSPETYLTEPLADYIRERGGVIRTNARIISIELDAAGRMAGLCVQHGDGTPELLTADDYLLALPIHNLKRLIPPSLQSDSYFAGLMRIESVPVITLHLWVDRQISYMDNILFNPDGIPVYADLANTTPDYRAPDDRGGSDRKSMATRKSRFQLVIAPADDWMSASDDEIVAHVWRILQSNFPETAKDATIEKYRIVRVPQSVYWPKPGTDQYRVPQKTPINNLFLAGGYTVQRFYDSMEGAVRSGNRAADAIMASHRNQPWQPTL
ncbi:MAG: FAD-dependent oxidoreductase [Aggregatilineales bacterium]